MFKLFKIPIRKLSFKNLFNNNSIKNSNNTTINNESVKEGLKINKNSCKNINDNKNVSEICDNNVNGDISGNTGK